MEDKYVVEKFNAREIYHLIRLIQAKEKKHGFFSAENYTKKGIRKWSCRLGVTKLLRGGTATYDLFERNHLRVYDSKSKAYRTIDINTLRNLKVCGKFLVKDSKATPLYKEYIDIVRVTIKLKKHG